MELAERLKTRIPDIKEELADELLQSASSFVLDQTNQTELSDSLRSLVLDLATDAFNRMGSEGITSESMSGTSVSYAEDMTRTQWHVIYKNRRPKGWS